MSFYLLCGHDPKSEPDRLEELGGSIPGNFVVARNMEGNVLSRFRDDSWNFTAYGAVTIFHIGRWCADHSDELAKTITGEIKTIFFLAMFNPRCQNKSKKKANSQHGLLTALKAIAKIAYHCKTRLRDAHRNPKFQAALKSSYLFSQDNSNNSVLWTSSHIKTILRVCHASAHDTFCSKLPKLLIVTENSYEEWCSRLDAAARYTRNENGKRTPLIPTRILALILTQTEKELDDAIPYMEGFVGFFEAILDDHHLFADNKNQGCSGRERITRSGRPHSGPVLTARLVSKEETLKRFDISDYLHEKGVGLSVQSICAHLTQLQTLSAILVHLYSGMRASEAEVMPYDCHQVINIPDFGEVDILTSHTTKMAKANYSKMLPWVTSPAVRKAIRVAQCIAKINWMRNTPKPFPSDLGTVPLWIASSWLSSNEPVHYKYPIGYKTYEFKSAVESFEGVEIRKSDLEELIVFDAFRAWDEEDEFQLGKQWPIASHQGRRAVAVYASRSGLVSLPSLATQYKHLTILMTALYAENSSFAESFIYDKHDKIPKSHWVIHEFRSSQKFNNSIAFEEQVVKTKRPLLGGLGKEFQVRKKKDLPKFIDDAAAIQKEIRTGKRKYVPLPTGGGCMNSTGPCASYGIDWTFPCYGCAKSIFDSNVLEEAAASLELAMLEMSTNSLAYKFSDEKLQMIKARINE